MGVATNRDAWIYNSSLEAITKTVKRMIETYNVEVERFTGTHTELQGEARRQAVSKFVTSDPKRISWSSSLLPKVALGLKGKFEATHLVKCLYRPFFKQWMYYDKMFNHRLSRMSQIFPTVRRKTSCFAVRLRAIV